MSTSLALVPLAAASDPESYGGKASGLASLIELDVPVPNGVVVPWLVFNDHLRATGLWERSAELVNSDRQRGTRGTSCS